jgi:hypothetical protein
VKAFDITVKYSRNSRQYLGPINLDFLISYSLKELFDDDLDLWTASTFPFVDYIILQAEESRIGPIKVVSRGSAPW